MTGTLQGLFLCVVDCRHFCCATHIIVVFAAVAKTVKSKITFLIAIAARLHWYILRYTLFFPALQGGSPVWMPLSIRMVSHEQSINMKPVWKRDPIQPGDPTEEPASSMAILELPLWYGFENFALRHPNSTVLQTRA